jgi:hypothetical protein
MQLSRESAKSAALLLKFVDSIGSIYSAHVSPFGLQIGDCQLNSGSGF